MGPDFMDLAAGGNIWGMSEAERIAEQNRIRMEKKIAEAAKEDKDLPLGLSGTTWRSSALFGGYDFYD